MNTKATQAAATGSFRDMEPAFIDRLQVRVNSALRYFTGTSCYFYSRESRYQSYALLTILMVILSIHSQAQIAQRSRLILIVEDGLTFDDLHLSDSTCPNLSSMAQHGSIGVMNCSVPEPKSNESAMLTIAVGHQALATPTDVQAANDWEMIRGEHASANVVFKRRLTGHSSANEEFAFDATRSVKHLGFMELTRRGLNTERLGVALQNAVPSIRCTVVGNADSDVSDRGAALLTVGADGAGSGMVALRRFEPTSPFGLADDPIALAHYALEADADFLVIQLGDGARAEASRLKLSDRDYREARRHAVARLDLLVNLLMTGVKSQLQPTDIMLISSHPPGSDSFSPTAWNHLAPIVGYGPRFPIGQFTSATTRTDGLVANVDISPTILDYYHLRIPSTMSGRPMRTILSSGAQHLANVARLDYVASLNGVGQVLIVLPYSVYCFVVMVGGVVLLHYRQKQMLRWMPLAVVFGLNFAAATLFAPLFVPPTLLEYGLRIVFWMAALTGVSYAIASKCKLSPPVSACILNVVLIAADAITGQHLLKDALLSNFPLAGFRYYGIANEYLGLLIAYSLFAGFGWLDDRRITSRIKFSNWKELSESIQARGISTLSAAQLITLFNWAALTLITGLPWFGANAGSLVVMTVGFGCGSLAILGRRLTYSWTAMLVGFGLMLTFAVSALDLIVSGAQRSHSGEALHAASTRGAGYLLEIAARKAAMNLNLLVSPWTMFSISLLVVILLCADLFAEERVDKLLEKRIWQNRGMTAILASCVTAFIFKDSGVTTVIYLLSGILLCMTYFLVKGWEAMDNALITTDSIPEGAANSEYASP